MAAAPLSDRLKSLLVDLGKPTLRGVRKCPKCGTTNGTRGISCKNKRCDVVFKDREKKKVQSNECIKIITGNGFQLYSVRLRLRGSDNRGFVQLPMIIDEDGNITSGPVDPEILVKASRCYVDHCPGNLQSGGLECSHIRAAFACTRDAEPLEITRSGIDAVAGLPDDVQNSLHELILESDAPAVQRATQNVMVVRCAATVQHPLGFVHLSLPNSFKDRSDLQRKIYCSCYSFNNAKEDGTSLCIHYYACICAFASNQALAIEFQQLLQMNLYCQSVGEVVMLLDFEDVLLSGPSSSINNDHNLVDLDRHVGQPQIMSSSGADSSEADLLLSTDVSQATLVHGDEIGDNEAFELIVEGDIQEVELDHVAVNKRLKLSDFSTRVCPAEAEGHNSSTSVTSSLHQTIAPATATSSIVLLKTGVDLNLTSPALFTRMHNTLTLNTEESNVLITFEDWLSSVTERINQTMHYQFDGNPEAMVFHIPQKFFDCLQQRMSLGLGGRKKRLPNTSVCFERRDELPLGNFIKYTWKLTNLLHVKQIFDTRQVALDITRRFIENADGTFTWSADADSPVESSVNCGAFIGRPLIKPSEFKTFLKIGNLMVGQRDPTPFILEWIPDILPQSHIGELRICFEYGHQRNGLVEVRKTGVDC